MESNHPRVNDGTVFKTVSVPYSLSSELLSGECIENQTLKILFCRQAPLSFGHTTQNLVDEVGIEPTCRSHGVTARCPTIRASHPYFIGAECRLRSDYLFRMKELLSRLS